MTSGRSFLSKRERLQKQIRLAHAVGPLYSAFVQLYEGAPIGLRVARPVYQVLYEKLRALKVGEVLNWTARYPLRVQTTAHEIARDSGFKIRTRSEVNRLVIERSE